jgi:diphosphate--fructose-6-phosphate 1-phosphotransferase
MKIGVVLSGGQAPGGHNVIAGIYDYAKKVSANSSIIGFLDGPQGIYTGQFCVIDDAMMDNYRNTGGFDMIGSGRHKIEKPEHFAASMQNCITLGLTGLVIIGGDDSNTNAALLAEYFEANNCPTKVCGCPKTIDGDLKVDPYIPISFGFDTACRTYSELIGNLGQDTLSSQKYYHFVRLMGRAASNIALECALFTRPNVCLISEEVEAKRMTLAQITKEVVDTIVMRSQMGKSYGIVLLPEGLIEFIPEFNSLIANINDVLATGVATTEEAVRPLLSVENQSVFDYLPELIKHQLLLDRDPHGNVQVAKIETERLLAQTVGMELEKLRAEGNEHELFSSSRYLSFPLCVF